jgi:1L-myo-inositol 1-phosphate cytidylyltransferase
VSARASVPVRDAVVLAAGNGDRFKNPHYPSKLLHPVLGTPLILRTLDTAAEAGILRFVVVLGYEASRVRTAIERHAMPGTSIRFTYNPDWQLENGISALRAQKLCNGGRFALLMGDHLFDPSVLQRLATENAAAGDCLLAIDDTSKEAAATEEATKVRLEGDRIVQIGKSLVQWDALDTGLFVFNASVFEALEEARQHGETTLSAGVQRLASKGLMRGVPVGGAAWCDVDTLDDLHAAESLVAAAEGDPA